jgi:hypothetical protein
MPPFRRSLHSPYVGSERNRPEALDSDSTHARDLRSSGLRRAPATDRMTATLDANRRAFGLVFIVSVVTSGT